MRPTCSSSTWSAPSPSAVQRWPDPRKPFFFRAPLIAIEALTRLGVDCVSLANNHALDFGATALLDTIGHLSDAGIACVGAGATETAAHAPAILEKGGVRVGLIGVTDHPSEYAAGNENPGVCLCRPPPVGPFLAQGNRPRPPY